MMQLNGIQPSFIFIIYTCAFPAVICQNDFCENNSLNWDPWVDCLFAQNSFENTELTGLIVPLSTLSPTNYIHIMVISFPDYVVMKK